MRTTAGPSPRSSNATSSAAVARTIALLNAPAQHLVGMSKPLIYGDTARTPDLRHQLPLEIVSGSTHVPGATKFGWGSLLSIVPEQDMDAIVTNPELPAEVANEYRAARARLESAGADGDDPA
jgi:PhoPQ-activated pathogenicity-related protein